MNCENITYSEHAIGQMFSRIITPNDVDHIVAFGETIAEYKNDKPYPSKLILGFLEKRPIHIVVAYNKENQNCIIVTAYQPDIKLWSNYFKTKKK